MRLYVYEVYKLWKKRLLWCILALLLLAAGMVFAIQQSDYEYLTENRFLYEELSGAYSQMPSGQALTILEEKKTEYEIRAAQANLAGDATAAIVLSIAQEEYPDLYAEVMRQRETLSAEELTACHQVYTQLYEEALYFSEYEEYLAHVQENADTMLSQPLFRQDGGFTLRSIQKTAEVFSHMEGLPITFGMAKGLEAATDYTAGDLMLLVSVLVVCLFLFAEKEEGTMLPLIKTTDRGRLPVIGAKLLTLLTATGVIWAVYTAGLYGWSRMLYGFGDITRPLASMIEYRDGGTCISVGQFLWRAALLKLAILLAAGMVFSSLCLAFRGSVLPSGGISLGIMGIELYLYQKVPSNAVFNHFKYVNLFCLTQGKRVFGDYRNLNLFSYPISIRELALPVSAAVMLAFCLLSLCLFVGLKGKAGAGKLQLLLEKVSSVWRSRDKSSGLFAEEGYKLLGAGRIILLVVLAALLGMSVAAKAKPVSYTVDEIVYRNYIKRVKGEFTQESQEYLEKRREDFEGMDEAIAAYRDMFAEGKITRTEMEAGIANIENTLGLQAKGFQKVLDDAEYARETKGWMLDQLTAEAWLGNTSRELRNGLVFGLAMVFCLSPVFAIDGQAGMSRLLPSTRKGRRPLVGVKLIWSMLLLLLLYACVYVPDVIALHKSYGAPLWEAPLRSVHAYREWRGDISIGSFYVAVQLARVIEMLMAGLILTLVSAKLGRQMPLLILSGILFLLPIVLQQQGIDLRYGCFNNAFLLAQSCADTDGLRKSLLHLAGTLVLGGVSTVAILRGTKERKGPRRGIGGFKTERSK